MTTKNHFVTRIDENIRKLSRSVKAIERKLKEKGHISTPSHPDTQSLDTAIARTEKTIQLYKLYRDAELAFLMDQLGLKEPPHFFLGNDESWSEVIAQSDDQELMALHRAIQNERAERAAACWNTFVATGDSNALMEYVSLGGVINTITRHALLATRGKTAKATDYDNYESFLDVTRKMSEINPETGNCYTLHRASETIAEEKFGADKNLETNTKRIKRQAEAQAEKFNLKLA